MLERLAGQRAQETSEGYFWKASSDVTYLNHLGWYTIQQLPRQGHGGECCQGRRFGAMQNPHYQGLSYPRTVMAGRYSGQGPEFGAQA